MGESKKYVTPVRCTNPSRWYEDFCAKHVSRAGTSNNITQILTEDIIYPCCWYLHLAHISWYAIVHDISPLTK